jgi:AcrR family transcriptional regulator
MNNVYIQFAMKAKPTRQLRSQDKRDRILVAMDELLQQREFAQLSVADLAQRAEVSPATLYQRFRNKDVLGSVLLALYFLRVEEWAQQPRQAPPLPANTSVTDALCAIAGNAWDQVVALRHVMRPAYLYSRQHPESTGPDWKRLEEMSLSGFRAFLQSMEQQLPAQDLAESAGTLAFLCNSMLLGPLLHAEDPRWQSPHGRGLFTTTFATVAGRYLLAPR